MKTFNKIYGKDINRDKNIDDKLDIGGIHGMTRTKDPGRVVSIIKENKDALLKLKGDEE